MKRFFPLLALAALAFGPTAGAQTEEYIIINGQRVTQPQFESRSWGVIETREFNGTSIRFSPMLEINVGNTTTTSYKKKARRPYRPFAFEGHGQGFAWGMNFLPKVDYSDYPDTDDGFMDLNVARSCYFELNPCNLGIGLNRANTFGIVTGIGMTWRDYVFSDNITITKQGGMVTPEAIDPKYKKSKLSTFSFMVPLTLEVQFPRRNPPSRRFFIAGGVYGDVALGVHTKYKKPKEKSKSNPYINTLSAGTTLRIGYGDVNLFCNYSLVPLFESDRGPDTKVMSVGIGFGF